MSLSMAIIEMTKPLNHTHVKSIDDTCPGNISTKEQKNKTLVDNELFDWDESTQVTYADRYKKGKIYLQIFNNTLTGNHTFHFLQDFT